MVNANPEYSAELAARISGIYADAADEMMEIIARRTAAGASGIEDGTHWAQMKLADIGRLRNELARKMPQVNDDAKIAISKAIESSYKDGADLAIDGSFFRANELTIKALQQEALTLVDDAQRAILRTTADDYRRIIADTASRVSLGTESVQQSIAKSLKQYAQTGIKGFTDSAGRNWEIETYAEMAMRTATGRAAIKGGIDRLTSKGHEFVIVSNAPEECSLCRPWEGRILAIDIGGDGAELEDGRRVKGTLSEAQAAGLFHANCRHNVTAYIPFLTDVPTNTEDPEGDQLRREHRAHERAVRKAKRETQVLAAQISETRKSSDLVDPKVIEIYRQAQQRQVSKTNAYLNFLDINDRKRLRYREAARGIGQKRYGRQDMKLVNAEKKLLADRLTPEQRFTSWGTPPNREELAKKYPNGQALVDGIVRWQSKPGGVEDIRKAMSTWLNKGNFDGVDSHIKTEAVEMLKALRHTPVKPPATLYRGMRITETYDEAILKWQTGQQIDLDLASFSSDSQVADIFATETSGRTPVRLIWEGAEKGQSLPIQNMATTEVFFGEKEWIGGGHFVVKSIDKTADGVVLHIKQIRGL